MAVANIRQGVLLHGKAPRLKILTRCEMYCTAWALDRTLRAPFAT